MKKKVMRWLKYIFTVCLLAFISFYLFKNIEQLKELEVTIYWPLMALAFLLYFFFKLGQSLVWYYITKKNQCNLPILLSLEAWFMSQLGRYIPGKIFYLGGRLV